MNTNETFPMVCSQPYLTALGLGSMPEKTPVVLRGINTDIDDAAEDIWEVGGIYSFQSAATGLNVVSSSANDTNSSGTGVKTIRVWYLDATFAEHTVDVTLNGTTPVTTTGVSAYRINFVEALTVGTGGVAAGNIDIRNAGAALTLSRIATGATQSRQAIFTVPKDKKFVVYQLEMGMASATNIGGRFVVRSNYSFAQAKLVTFFVPYTEVTCQSGSVVIPLNAPSTFPAGTDLRVIGVGMSATASIVATIAARGWLQGA